MPSSLIAIQRIRLGVVLLLLGSNVVGAQGGVDSEGDSIPARLQSLEQHSPVTFLPGDQTQTTSTLATPSSTGTPTWRSSPGARTFLLTTTTPTKDPEPTSDSPPYEPGSYEPLTRDEEKSNELLNLFFLLLALGMVLVFAAVYVVRKRKRSKGERAMQRGQVALRRDLEAGGWRMGVGRVGGWGGGGAQRREEGLDERGEAPPPYVPPLPQEGEAGERGEEGYPLPRIPERAVVGSRLRAMGEEDERRVGGGGAVGGVVVLPRYDEVVEIPPGSGPQNGIGNGNEAVATATEVVGTPPAAGTAPMPMERL